MKVAIYTIALNEEQFVQRWYDSAKDADYLLIADTGSTDRTVKLAKQLGINVIDVRVKPWRFDYARNAAMAALPEDIDYCISLDMDEVITPNWKKPLQEAFAKGITRPLYKHIWSWDNNGNPGLEFSYDHIHSRSNYVWKHPVHECLYVYGREETRMFVSGIETHHHPDPTKSRSQYLGLLKMAVDEEPLNDRNAFYYARELFFNGRFEESTKEFKRHLELPTATWKPERAASMRYIAKMDDQSDVVIWWLNKAVKEAPNRREAFVDLAKHYYNQKKWSECLDAAQSALEIVEKPLEYLCEEFAWGYAPHDYAAIAAYNLGLTDIALKHGMNALELNPTDERLERNIMFYKA